MIDRSKALGEQVLEYRARHNISQEDFANLAKLNVMTVNAIENNKYNPTKLTVRKIEIVLRGEAGENAED